MGLQFKYGENRPCHLPDSASGPSSLNYSYGNALLLRPEHRDDHVDLAGLFVTIRFIKNQRYSRHVVSYTFYHD